MKKAISVALAMLLIMAPCVFSAAAPSASSSKSSATPVPTPVPTAAGNKMSIIQQKVQEKMDAINRVGNNGQQNVGQEIIINKYKKKDTKQVDTTINEAKFDMGSLGLMNTIGGMFEGGLAGACIGLIGYSKSGNIDNKYLIGGAIAGTFTGAGLGAALSLYQSISQRYSSSDDFAMDLAGGIIIGTFLGTGGGIISYGKTGHLENVSEGIGWGVLAGTCLGLVLGTVETFMPEEYRGASMKLRASNTEDGSTVLSCNYGF